MHLHRHLPSGLLGWAIPARADSITLDQAIQIALARMAVEFYRGHDDWQLALQPVNK